ncbi:MAG: class I SAM-dependent methyltransferase [Acidobacteria bacterium]|nr:class I SAM-dependent methyltransferase [Acidobacteriota bacterium]
MSVASHLGIKTTEYDRQILTFIPHYDEILDQAVGALAALDRPAKVVLDLGTGSGALAARCLARLRGARVVGIDGDEAMLAMAVKRLGGKLTPVVGYFENTPFPACDVITASFSLHHVPEPAVKAKIFRKAFAALRPGGVLVDADCMVAADPALRARHHDLWHRHLAVAHGPAGARKFLRAWAGEDTYFPLELEMSLLRDAGFVVDVAWRKDGFAVLAATRPRRRPGAARRRSSAAR